jgi:signal transduction histidine kinase
VILAGFAGIVGVLTTGQVRGQFTNQVNADAQTLLHRLGTLHVNAGDGRLDCDRRVGLSDFASSGSAQIRIIDRASGFVFCTQDQVLPKGATIAQGTPNFSLPLRPGTFDELGYRVAVRPIRIMPSTGPAYLLYARPYSDVEHTLAKVRIFLILGVLGGTILALAAGLANAARAMRPISELSDAAREIERTRDPSLRIPHPEAEDEVAELARTLEGMLAALDAARSETEAMLERQREFVADASHELRTPLTSVLANLELLADELGGEQAESAKGALRSTRRMRRLVGDLLLLARADAQREQRVRPTDLGEVLLEAAAELGPVAGTHDVMIDAQPARLDGIRDDLHRLTLNLLENAIRHTPPGTRIRAATATSNGRAVLRVEDDGPGISVELAERVFERFVRGGGDGGRSSRLGGRGSGLGLAIVRAVAESHGGTVTLDEPHPEDPENPGTRFVIVLPAARPEPATPAERELQTSTTTGSTIGRRRSRS